MKPISFLIFALLVLTCCEAKPRVESRMAITSLPAPKSYEVLEFTSDVVLGDILEKYKLRISSRDYEIISAAIMSNQYFRDQPTDSLGSLMFENSIPIKERAYSKGQDYFYFKLILEDAGEISVILSEGEIMKISYIRL